MRIRYSKQVSNSRGYDGFLFESPEFENSLTSSVRDSMIDRPERTLFESDLTGLAATGFSSERLLADLQLLNNDTPEDLRTWRIGEAFADVVLEEQLSVRFHWNERRDARNIRGNKTGADLVGFIEIDGLVLFMFGEVKTSSETANRPPQVMTGGQQMEEQLRDLHDNKQLKRFNLIQYLASKTRNLDDIDSFKLDYKRALANYYANGSINYQLLGVLIRDVEPSEEDLKESFERLNTSVLEPNGIRLLACYTPIEKSEWSNIISSAV